jgi:hypothetical protein
MSEDQLFILALAIFVLAVYGSVFGFSLAADKSVLPYVGMLALHALSAVWLRSQLNLDRSGEDAAGKGMSLGLTWLYWGVANVGLGVVSLVIFGVRKLVGI